MKKTIYLDHYKKNMLETIFYNRLYLNLVLSFLGSEYPKLPLLLAFHILFTEITRPIISFKNRFLISVNMLNWSIDSGCNFDTSNDTLFCWAASVGNIEVLLHIKHTYKNTLLSRSVCLAAATKGNLEALQWLRSQVPPCPWVYISE